VQQAVEHRGNQRLVVCEGALTLPRFDVHHPTQP
jgi:hypothetical protein